MKKEIVKTTIRLTVDPELKRVGVDAGLNFSQILENALTSIISVTGNGIEFKRNVMVKEQEELEERLKKLKIGITELNKIAEAKTTQEKVDALVKEFIAKRDNLAGTETFDNLPAAYHRIIKFRTGRIVSVPELIKMWEKHNENDGQGVEA